MQGRLSLSAGILDGTLIVDVAGPTVNAARPPTRRGTFTSPIDRSTISRTMLEMKIDRDERVALHNQAAAEIRKAIGEGEAAPGDRLPLAKDIAAVLGFNKNTVLRALHILREEGLLEFRRGRGITMVGTPERSALVERIRELLEFARRQGYRPEEVVGLIDAVSRSAS
jgi:GntR family transcriptional regulator